MYLSRAIKWPFLDRNSHNCVRPVVWLTLQWPVSFAVNFIIPLGKGGGGEFRWASNLPASANMFEHRMRISSYYVCVCVYMMEEFSVITFSLLFWPSRFFFSGKESRHINSRKNAVIIYHRWVRGGKVASRGRFIKAIIRTTTAIIFHLNLLSEC